MEQEEEEDHHVMSGANSGVGEGRAPAGGKKASMLDEYGPPKSAMARFGYVGGVHAPFPPEARKELTFEKVGPLGPLGSSSSKHRRTPEIVLQKDHASFRITSSPPVKRRPPSHPSHVCQPSH